MINLIKNDKNDIGKIKTLPVWMVLLLFIIALTQCNHKKVIYTPLGYNITQPQTISLGSKLDEISGICWVSDSLMLANNDESGRIFAINLANLKDLEYRNFKFGEKGDYEDIVKVDSAIYLLVATGKIVRVTGFQNEDSVKSEVVAELPGIQNEFESLYYDKEVNSLIMLCKDCHKEKNRIRSAYRFDLSRNELIDSPYYQIQVDQIRKITENNEADFRPSAAAVNPRDGKVYIVSSIGKLMVVINKKGKVEQAFGISGIMFPQPEGITFADNGDMYISNEIASEQASTLLKFRYTKPK
jgi:hypothetical protein